jgi:hypothetical protein
MNACIHTSKVNLPLIALIFAEIYKKSASSCGNCGKTKNIRLGYTNGKPLTLNAEL